MKFKFYMRFSKSLSPRRCILISSPDSVDTLNVQTSRTGAIEWEGYFSVEISKGKSVTRIKFEKEEDRDIAFNKILAKFECEEI